MMFQDGCEKLELALLSFFEQFRKIYVGDQVRSSSHALRFHTVLPQLSFTGFSINDDHVWGSKIVTTVM